MAVANSTKTYTTEYHNLKGVDFSSGAENVNQRRSPTGYNMISDVGGNPMKRRGWERVLDSNMYEVLQLWSFAYHEQEHLICHIYDGTYYWLCRYDLQHNKYSDTKFKVKKEVVGFYTATDIDSIFNIICAEKMYEYLWDDSKGFAEFTRVEPYVPIMTIGCNMTNGGGVIYENLNLLSKELRERFLGDSSYTFDDDTKKQNNDRTYSKESQITLTADYSRDMPLKVTMQYKSVNKSSSAPYVYTFGAMTNGTGSNTKVVYTYEDGSWTYEKVVSKYVNGNMQDTKTSGSTTEISFSTTANVLRIPSNTYYPLIDGEDNVEVQYFLKDADGNYATTQSAFLSCNQTALYDNRVWLAGAKGDFGNRIWYSDITQDGYYPELNYIIVGSNDTDALGLVPLGEYLGVVKEPSSVETTVFLVYPTTFDSNGTYACKNYVSGVGALSSKSFVAMEGEALFLAKDGIYGLKADSIKNRSYFVNKALTQEVNLDKACAVSWDSYYVLCVNSKCYVLDTRQKSGWGTEWTNYNYECYFWNNIPAVAFATYDGTLWFIHEDGSLCRFRYDYDDYCYRDEVDTPIKAEWSTLLDNDGATQLYKTLQKKGTVCTIRPYGHTSVDMYINVDDNKMISIGRQYGDTLDFGDVWFDEGRFTFSSTDAPLDCFFKKKVKKYKRLQFILRNEELDEPFMVESLFKSYTVQGYSKRKSGDGVYPVNKGV